MENYIVDGMIRSAVEALLSNPKARTALAYAEKTPKYPLIGTSPLI